MTLRLDHVAHVSRDAAATVDFYRDILGLAPDRIAARGAEMLRFALPGGGSLVFSVRPNASAPSAVKSNWEDRHAGLAVSSQADLDACALRLRERGVPHRVVDGNRLYFADPDGLVIELEAAEDPGIGA